MVKTEKVTNEITYVIVLIRSKINKKEKVVGKNHKIIVVKWQKIQTYLKSGVGRVSVVLTYSSLYRRNNHTDLFRQLHCH